MSDQERSEAMPPRKGPFGLRRRHYIAVRVLLALGLVIVGVTLHHHGAAYDVIRGAYLIVIVALILWRINNRRQRRRARI